MCAPMSKTTSPDRTRRLMRTCSSDSHGTVAHGEPASRKWDNPSRKSIQSCCRWLTTMGTACSALRRRANAKVHRVLPRRPLLRYQRTSVGSTPLVGGTIRVRFAELPTVAVGTVFRGSRALHRLCQEAGRRPQHLAASAHGEGPRMASDFSIGEPMVRFMASVVRA